MWFEILTLFTQVNNKKHHRSETPVPSSAASMASVHYTGVTKNLYSRLTQHQAGEGANHTKNDYP